jgi:octaprenyl-diphosphate synthase
MILSIAFLFEKEREEALAKFGMDVGIAFQLIDDNLDYISDKSGKKIGIDLQEGKVTSR